MHMIRCSTTSALRRRGLSTERIRAEVAARRWQRLGQAAVLHNGPLSERQRWMAARIHAGPKAVLTAFTATQAFGLRGWERDAAHVLAPGGTRLRRECPVPVTLHLVADWQQVEIPRRSVLLAAVHDIAQGAQALSEIDFARLGRRFGLPEPERQAVRSERSGRRRYLDAVWRRADGRLVVVEVDGAVHLAVNRWWADQLRQNELTLADAIVLRYPSVVVREEPALVAAQLLRALNL